MNLANQIKGKCPHCQGDDIKVIVVSSPDEKNATYRIACESCAFYPESLNWDSLRDSWNEGITHVKGNQHQDINYVKHFIPRNLINE